MQIQIAYWTTNISQIQLHLCALLGKQGAEISLVAMRIRERIYRMYHYHHPHQHHHHRRRHHYSHRQCHSRQRRRCRCRSRGR